MTTPETPINSFIQTMLSEQEQRHQWIIEAAEKIRRWKAEDEANGQPWATSKLMEHNAGRMS